MINLVFVFLECYDIVLILLLLIMVNRILTIVELDTFTVKTMWFEALSTRVRHLVLWFLILHHTKFKTP